MKLPLKQIFEIAEKLNGGMKGFFNLKTMEVRWYLVFDELIDDNEEPWEEDLSEVQKNKKEYVALEGMNFNERFHLMADFATRIDNPEIRSRLLRALNQTLPVTAFNKNIHKSGKYWKQWQEYKLQAHIDWVERWSKLLEKYSWEKSPGERKSTMALMDR